jgi:hypothetical protein
VFCAHVAEPVLPADGMGGEVHSAGQIMRVAKIWTACGYEAVDSLMR